MNYIKIDSCNMNNGNGLRCVVWVSGCNHHCKNCFNPETWDNSNGDEFGEEQFSFIRDTLHQSWCSGITFSGGDPLCQDPQGFHYLNKLALTTRSLGKTVWLWTGFKWEDIWNDESEIALYRQNLLSLCDVVVDGQYVDSLRDLTLKWRGSSNQRVILSRMSISKKELILMEGT